MTRRDREILDLLPVAEAEGTWWARVFRQEAEEMVGAATVALVEAYDSYHEGVESLEAWCRRAIRCDLWNAMDSRIREEDRERLAARRPRAWPRRGDEDDSEDDIPDPECPVAVDAAWVHGQSRDEAEVHCADLLLELDLAHRAGAITFAERDVLVAKLFGAADWQIAELWNTSRGSVQRVAAEAHRKLRGRGS